MRLVKIQLEKDIPFWFLNEIHLTPNNRVSQLFDIDTLDYEDKEKINASIKRCNIKVFDSENKLLFNLGEHKIFGNLPGFSGGLSEDIEVDEVELPEVISVTCASEEDEEEDNYTIPTEEDFKEAEILLSKNGNTVRKAILNFSLNSDSIKIIYACLELEERNGQRASIIKAINTRIEEYGKRET